MSYITNIILLAEVEEPAIKEVQDWLRQNGRETLRDATETLTGYAMEAAVRIGAYNFFPIEEFIPALQAMKWGWPESAQLVFKVQDDEGFTFLPLFDRFDQPVPREKWDEDFVR